MEKHVDVAIIGAGTSGLTALGMVRRSTDNFVLINGGALGTTCARVGCMPSKVLIQVAEDFHRRHQFERYGISGKEHMAADISEGMEHVRDLRDVFVDRVLSNSTDKLPEDKFIEGYARFLEAGVLEVGEDKIHAKAVIIATGSRPLIPAAWQAFRERILTTDELFEQEELPASLAVLGLGVIGLELGQSLHRLGVAVVGIDKLTSIGGLQDPEVNKMACELLGQEFPLWLGHAAEISEGSDGKLNVAAGGNSVEVHKVLASLGRIPNVDNLGLENLNVELLPNGVPKFDPNTMQIGDLPVFIAGDVTGDRAILHEAGHEGRIAAFNATNDKVLAFKRKPALSITFCDPNIANVGAGWNELDQEISVVGEIRFAPVGRALIMGKNKGVLRVYADKRDGKLLGASMIAPKGENLAHLLAWCMQQNLTVPDLLNMPFYHPVIEEALQAALHDALGQLEHSPQLPVGLELLS